MSLEYIPIIKPDDQGNPISIIVLSVIGVLLTQLFICCCYCCCRGRRRSSNDTNCLCLLLCLPFLPFIWLYFLYRRYRSATSRKITSFFRVRRPETNRVDPPVKHFKRKNANEGFSWFVHSYMACLIQWRCCKIDFTKDMSASDAIKRYGERKPEERGEMLKKIQQNIYLNFLIEYLNRKEPKLYFRILPSGSIRERFGFPVPSTSVLATDYDLMLVPYQIYVCDDENTGERDRYPESFIAEDIKEINPERPEEIRGTGYLWLKLSENAPDVWKKLCYERITTAGVIHFLSQLAVLDVIIQHIGKRKFLKQLKNRLHSLNKEDDEEISEIDENLAGSASCDYEVRSERTGPALNISITEKRNKSRMNCLGSNRNTILDVDFTLALAHPKFPQVASYFIKRWEDPNKRWPIDEEVYDKIIQGGCHIVPKPSKKKLATFQNEQISESYLGASAVLEWRYSFSQAEMLLSDYVPEVARTSYMAFKAVVKTHVNRSRDRFISEDNKNHQRPRRPIPSYVLKTILYYELEDGCLGDGEKAGESFFMALLISLLAKVQARNCPSYWIEGMNLFAEMEDQDFKYFEEKLGKVKSNPCRYIASNWLEWNRYVSTKCCASCFEQAHEKVYVINVDGSPEMEGYFQPKAFSKPAVTGGDAENHKDMEIHIY